MIFCIYIYMICIYIYLIIYTYVTALEGSANYPCLKDDCFTWLSTNTSNDHTKVSNSWSLSNWETPTNPATPYGCTFPWSHLRLAWAKCDGMKTAIIWLLHSPTGTIEGTPPMVSHWPLFIIRLWTHVTPNLWFAFCLRVRLSSFILSLPSCKTWNVLQRIEDYRKDPSNFEVPYWSLD